MGFSDIFRKYGKYFAKNTLKFPKNDIFGHFDTWSSLDFRKSIRDPTPGHSLKSIPDSQTKKTMGLFTVQI